MVPQIYVPKGKGRWCKLHPYGKGYAMFFDKHGDPWVTIGPNYFFTLILYIFMTVLSVVLVKIVVHADNKIWYLKLIAAGVIFLAYFSLSLTVLLNPGHPSNRQRDSLPSMKWCSK
jgi:hypothetical protein